MTKVKYNGEYIELCDELEPGYLELDLLTEEDKVDELEDTKEFNFNSLEDTQILNVGDNDE